MLWRKGKKGATKMKKQEYEDLKYTLEVAKAELQRAEANEVHIKRLQRINELITLTYNYFKEE